MASGIKQKNIEDVLDLENRLHLDRIVPMQTSYTQTAEDREGSEQKEQEEVVQEDEETVIEPTETDSEE